MEQLYFDIIYANVATCSKIPCMLYFQLKFFLAEFLWSSQISQKRLHKEAIWK